MEFEWDPAKAASNLRKHEVSFNEAATVFGDLLSATACDPDHSVDEQHYISLGFRIEAACCWWLIRKDTGGFESLAPDG